MSNQTKLKAQAARAKMIAQWAAITLLTLFAAERLSPPMIALGTGKESTLGPLAAAFIQLLPAVLYTYALWALRGAFGRIAAGETFARELGPALRRTGWALIAGGVTAIAIVPTAQQILDEGPSYVFELDAGAIAIAAIGAGLLALARLVAEAAAAKAELDGFF